MGQKKLRRFSEIRTFPNFFEYPEGMAGKWCEYFNNDHPIILELACGKGEYATGMGRIFPRKNFIGIDLKSNRMWVGAKKALKENLSNVVFLRSQIEKLTDYFLPGEVAEIWLTFPDPQLRQSKAKKRLTHPRFLRLYKNVLEENGSIHVKTDSPDLYAFTKSVIELYNLPLIEDLSNVHEQGKSEQVLMIQTHYEQLDIARSERVHYLRFSLTNSLDENKDKELKQLVREEATV
ncbi:MAG TPA: tRNA (guanosine(46)-N7)-methyltransferase TrmB [Flavitalea sp.]|nr:tRNA (guanosine(46)-N7)-methyltransferase TrmB [Flavitalea sp.]